MEVAFSYTKKRCEFGIQCIFQDIPAELVNTIEPSTEFESKIIFRNPTILDIDLTATMSESSAGTERVELCQAGMHHEEGGWPREVDIDDIESKNRFRKKAKAGPLSENLKKIGPVVSESVRQNSTINLYEEFFEGEMEDHSSEPPSVKGLAKFRDPNDVKRQATQISWNPEGPTKIAVAYSILNFQDQRFSNERLPTQSYIWDVNNPNTPEQELNPVSPLCCLRFNKNADTLVGGSYNGLISFFDIRKSGGTPCESSMIENSHHDPVYDVHWIQSKTNTQCASVSTDGRMLWWDVRRLGEPTDVVELYDEENQLLGGSSMAYLQEAGPTKYLVGSEQGAVISVNMRNKKQGSAISVFDQGAGRHHAPIYSIERNPVHPKFFLTVGDWTARIWTEDLKTPIMMTHYHQSYLTSGCWSPTRAGVFFVTRRDGVVDIWDYFHTQSEVAYSHKVGDVSLTSIAVQGGQRGAGGKFVAIGDEEGTVSLLEVCDSLSVPRSNEKAAMLGMFDRETKREKNLVIRIKDMKRRQQQIVQEKKAESDISKESSAEKMQTLIKKVEEDFDKLIQEVEKPKASEMEEAPVVEESSIVGGASIEESQSTVVAAPSEIVESKESQAEEGVEEEGSVPVIPASDAEDLPAPVEAEDADETKEGGEKANPEMDASMKNDSMASEEHKEGDESSVVPSADAKEDKSESKQEAGVEEESAVVPPADAVKEAKEAPAADDSEMKEKEEEEAIEGGEKVDPSPKAAEEDVVIPEEDSTAPAGAADNAAEEKKDSEAVCSPPAAEAEEELKEEDTDMQLEEDEETKADEEAPYEDEFESSQPNGEAVSEEKKNEEAVEASPSDAAPANEQKPEEENEANVESNDVAEGGSTDAPLEQPSSEPAGGDTDAVPDPVEPEAPTEESGTVGAEAATAPEVAAELIDSTEESADAFAESTKAVTPEATAESTDAAAPDAESTDAVAESAEAESTEVAVPEVATVPTDAVDPIPTDAAAAESVPEAAPESVPEAAPEAAPESNDADATTAPEAAATDEASVPAAEVDAATDQLQQEAEPNTVADEEIKEANKGVDVIDSDAGAVGPSESKLTEGESGFTDDFETSKDSAPPS